MDIDEARTLLFGPKPTPDDAVINDVLQKLWETASNEGEEMGYQQGKDEGCSDCYNDGQDEAYQRGYEEGKHAEQMAGTDDE
jgi:flagellar biosynthesis/type III secretory pathway protein FliH